MVFQITQEPILALGTLSKNLQADYVRADKIIVTSLPRGSERIVGRLIRQQRDRDKRRRSIAPLAFEGSGQNHLSIIGRLGSQPLRFVLFAHVVEHGRYVSQPAP